MEIKTSSDDATRSVRKKGRKEETRRPNNREVLTAVLRFARYSERGMEGAERSGNYATYAEFQNRQNGIGDRERERGRMPRMPQIFNVKIIGTDGRR